MGYEKRDCKTFIVSQSGGSKFKVKVSAGLVPSQEDLSRAALLGL